MGSYSTMKRNEPQIHRTTQMDLKSLIFSKGSKTLEEFLLSDSLEKADLIYGDRKQITGYGGQGRGLKGRD